MSSTSLSMQRIWRALIRRWLQSRNNRRIRSIGNQVAQAHAQLREEGNYEAAWDTNSPVVFFNASTRLSGLSLNAAYSLISSWGIQLCGVPVIHFVCQAGLSPCVLGTDQAKPDRQPPCQECIRQSRMNYNTADACWFEFQPDDEVAMRLQNLSIDGLTAFEYQGVPLGNLVLPSIRWILRCYHLEDTEKNRYLYGQYILSAWRVAQEFQHLLEKEHPQAVVVFNGILYPEAMARWVARQAGIRVVSHEVNMGAYSAFFTEEEATFRTMDIPDDFSLDEKQTHILDGYLENRFSGNFKMAGIRFWPEIVKPDETFKQYAENFKQIVPVFTNVIFDTSQVHANTVFADMFDWLDHLLQIMHAHPETLFIIRAHPDELREGKASRETVQNWVDSNHLEQMSNVLFVGPDEHISSYELIQQSKFILTYNSTIGLEATLLGTAAVCAGKAHYTQQPTVYFPQSVDAYQKQVESFLATTDKLVVPEHFVENGRRFLYYQLFLTSLPFTEFIEEDGVWRGYVRLKNFHLQQLFPQNSATLQAITQGILKGKAFVLPG